MAKYAYVTMISGGDSYVPGIEALGQSLRSTGTSYQRVVMATDDVPETARQALLAQGWIIRPIAPIDNPSQNQLYARYARSFTKLRVWQLTEYERVVFLDGDTIVLHNIDSLFSRPAPIAAAPDFFSPDQFNSGAMVLRPSEEMFASMVQALAVTPTYDGGDQGFLNEFFHWYQLPVENRLPAGFNLHHFIYAFMQAHQAVQRMAKNVHVIHYTLQKPWKQRLTLAGGSELWWRTYYGVHPELDRPWKHRLHRLEDQVFKQVVGYLER